MDTLFIGKNIIHLKSVDSTNNYALALIRQEGTENKKISEGTVISAAFQEKGKGQRGNTWESEEAKNVLISIILKPAFLKASEQFLLNKIISLGIYNFLIQAGLNNISVKWPNDLLVNEKKIAGVLMENLIQSDYIKYSVIGIGINVNQEHFSSNANATSMLLEIGQPLSPDNCIEKLCGHIESLYLKLNADPQCCDSSYIKSLYRYGQWGKYRISGELHNGLITGVSPTGQLILKTENDFEGYYNFKEVEFL